MLKSFELTVIKLILEREASDFISLKNQAENLNEISRRFTGTGIFIDFNAGEDFLCKNCPSSMRLGQSMIAKIGLEKRLIGFILYIDNGAIVTLESFAYEGAWVGENIENAILL
jgi:hypothetical protein